METEWLVLIPADGTKETHLLLHAVENGGGWHWVGLSPKYCRGWPCRGKNFF